MFDDYPKLLGQPAALEARLRDVEQPHIAPLTKFVRELRKEAGPDASIPFFDPWDGGTEAEVLFLLEAPGPKARNSGFVSRNNPDETAKNLFELLNEAGIPRKSSVVWNIVPWYIGSGTKIRPAKLTDISAGMTSLDELIGLLPKLRCVALVGRKSQQAEYHLQERYPLLIIEQTPHPSPMFINRRPENRTVLLDRLCHIRKLLESRTNE
ncbi:uracil-DNA glycosylase [Marinihelvus fidelis]|uniref:Uracil-DNA glycosylase n=1 Tax=Marinihelvus fidelis TaxID=2613842 RepID=A0A5N0T4E5_9GAMM|nr:uracil-DNA glycosylase [Marinihelvus fidelis]KAA9129678.1 uracil-DNA glycosylase [Marinihelvus fidelis]